MQDRNVRSLSDEEQDKVASGETVEKIDCCTICKADRLVEWRGLNKSVVARDIADWQHN